MLSQSKRIAAAAVAACASSQFAAAQVCIPYYADLGDLTLQWYAMSWAVYDNGEGPEVYKASIYGDFIERLTHGYWLPVSRKGLPIGWAVRSVFSTSGPWGERLYISGRMQQQYSYFRWGGTSWINDGINIGLVDGFASAGGQPVVADLGQGPTMFATAVPLDPPFPIDHNVVKFENGHWVVIGECDRYVTTLLALPDGAHQALWAVGDFPAMNGVPARGIAKWNGQSWTGYSGPQFESGYSQAVVADLGNGLRIYDHGPLEGQTADGLCSFDGTQWTYHGSPDPFPPPYTPPYVTTLGVFDDGRGPAIYIGGIFRGYAGVTARNIVRFDGTSFEAVGAGIVGEPDWFGAYRDIRGSAMFIGGDVLTGAGGGTLQQSAVALVGCGDGQCYANCDLSTSSPKLNVNDFMCFINAYARRDPYANCTVDADMNVADFLCFMNKFAAGCS